MSEAVEGRPDRVRAAASAISSASSSPLLCSSPLLDLSRETSRADLSLVNGMRMVLTEGRGEPFEPRPRARGRALLGAGASSLLEVGSGSSESSQLGRCFPPTGGPDCDLGLASRGKLRRPVRASRSAEGPPALEGASALGGRVMRMSPTWLMEPRTGRPWMPIPGPRGEAPAVPGNRRESDRRSGPG